jgi:hypothetical protein
MGVRNLNYLVSAAGQRCWSAMHCPMTHDQAPATFLIMKENENA